MQDKKSQAQEDLQRNVLYAYRWQNYFGTRIFKTSDDDDDVNDDDDDAASLISLFSSESLSILLE